jgi:endonuclease YncB( thermonuclease family)
MMGGCASGFRMKRTRSGFGSGGCRCHIRPNRPCCSAKMLGLAGRLVRFKGDNVHQFRRRRAPWYPGEAAPRRTKRPTKSLQLYLLSGLVFVLTFGGGLLYSQPRLLGARSQQQSPVGGGDFTCTVTGVHDGDGPIYCAEGPKIRLNAIAARELDETCRSGHPCPSTSGAAARAELTRLASGKVLRCEATGTSYSRVTAWCWTPEGTELNCAMVQGGYALRWPKHDPYGRLCRRT